MVILYVTYFAILIVFTVVGFICLKIKSCGINVRDFFRFILAIKNLDALYIYAKSNENMTKSEQIMFLREAEKIFSIFERIPSIIWEDEYDKYEQVLETYRNIRLMKWSEIAV